jgi:hypothetical protein
LDRRNSSRPTGSPGPETPSNGNIDFLKLWLEIDRKPDPIAARLPVFPALAFVERAREIVRANDEFEAAWKVAKEHPDFLAAETRNEALSERWRRMALRVATTPAKTAEGLVAKLAMVWSAYGDGELDGTYDGVLASAVRDAHALENTVALAGKGASSSGK